MAERQDSKKRVDDDYDHGQINLAEKGSAMISAASRSLTHLLDHLRRRFISGQSPWALTLEDGKQVLELSLAEFGSEGTAWWIPTRTGVQ